MKKKTIMAPEEISTWRSICESPDETRTKWGNLQFDRKLREQLIKMCDALEQKQNATYCAYCGEEFPLDTVTADQVGEHIAKCPKHPIAALKKQIAELEYQQEADTSTVGILADVVDVLWEDDSRCEKHGYGDAVAKAKEVVARAKVSEALEEKIATITKHFTALKSACERIRRSGSTPAPDDLLMSEFDYQKLEGPLGELWVLLIFEPNNKARGKAL